MRRLRQDDDDKLNQSAETCMADILIGNGEVAVQLLGGIFGDKGR